MARKKTRKIPSKCKTFISLLRYCRVGEYERPYFEDYCGKKIPGDIDNLDDLYNRLKMPSKLQYRLNILFDTK